jgi:hypothetical protein
MSDSTLVTRKRKMDAWKAAERMTQSWLNFLESVPANKALTEKEWYAAWRKHAQAHANPQVAPA